MTVRLLFTIVNVIFFNHLFQVTYRDCKNSVTVSGVSEDKITLIFSDDNFLQYEELIAAGCFSDVASEKLFVDKDTKVCWFNNVR